MRDACVSISGFVAVGVKAWLRVRMWADAELSRVALRAYYGKLDAATAASLIPSAKWSIPASKMTPRWVLLRGTMSL